MVISHLLTSWDIQVGYNYKEFKPPRIQLFFCIQMIFCRFFWVAEGGFPLSKWCVFTSRNPRVEWTISGKNTPRSPKTIKRIDFHQRLFFVVGNLNHLKLGTILLIVLDFQGHVLKETYLAGCSTASSFLIYVLFWREHGQPRAAQFAHH